MRTLLIATLLLVGLSACVSNPTKPQYDQSNLANSNPATILVLPPTNDSTDVDAGPAVLSQVSYPLAESGFYVLPVGLTSEVFQQNGITVAQDAQEIAPQKLREIFGADAALYLHISQYGSSYQVIQSVAKVEVSAKLVDTRTGELLWENSALVQDSSDSSSGLISSLISAAVSQIANSVGKHVYRLAGTANFQLLYAGSNNKPSLLFGPRSPYYQDPTKIVTTTPTTSATEDNK